MGRNYRYSAISPTGEPTSGTLVADDRQSAFARLAQGGQTITELAEIGTDHRRGQRGQTAIRVLALRQLAVLLRARVELLEALESVAKGLPQGAVADGLATAAQRLRRGDSLSAGLSEGLPDMPPYILALVAAGEASGQLDTVIEQAAQQLAFEESVSRDLRTAMVYPAFLVGAGLVAMTFLFAVVVPRFAQMLGPRRDALDGLPAIVIGLGEAVRDNGLLALLLLAGIAVATVAGVSSPGGRATLARLAERLPVIGTLAALRQRAHWARVMALALGARVGLIDAAALAQDAVADGPFRDALGDATRKFRAGVSVADALGESGALGRMETSLVRAGQRSGALAEMFGVIADFHDQQLRAGIKRASTVIEQLAILIVALAIGVTVLSLVSAMTSVYEAIQ